MQRIISWRHGRDKSKLGQQQGKLSYMVSEQEGRDSMRITQAFSNSSALRCVVASIPLGNVLPVRASDAAGNGHSQFGD